MRIDVLTLFPEACEPFFASSVLGRARRAGCVTIQCHNLRDYSADPHRKVDDRPFGGGPGMVMMCQPVLDAVEAVESDGHGPAARILLTPQGRRLDQSAAEDLASQDRLILVAGHYEGFDERIRAMLCPIEISVGDYVLSGGESAAMVLVDAVVRLLPGALGDPASTTEESFSAMDPVGDDDSDNGRPDEGPMYLEYPQYTRPRVCRGLAVPEVLISGDHAKIRAWRRQQSIERTRRRRPDLLAPQREKRQEDRH
jgi:tRNA (guanine37-N1)-methyltransferase